MAGTVKATYITEPGSATNNITLDTNGNMTSAGTVAMSTPFTMRNKIINGAMDIWQRGTSGFGPGGYGADRWYLDGASATSQRSTDVPNSSFLYSNEWGYPGSASCSIRQRIEAVNCRDLAGQTITVSLWAKSTSGTTSLSYSLSYPATTDNFTGVAEGNIASFVQIGAASLSTSWTYYSFSVAIPAAATTGLQLSFNRNTGGPATTRITGVQLERGTIATPFEYRNYQQELAMCRRYYKPKTGSYSTQFLGAGTSGYNQGYTISLNTTMRVVPTVTVYDGVPTAGKIYFNGNGVTGNVDFITTDQFRIYATTPSTGAITFAFDWEASAEL